MSLYSAESGKFDLPFFGAFRAAGFQC